MLLYFKTIIFNATFMDTYFVVLISTIFSSSLLIYDYDTVPDWSTRLESTLYPLASRSLSLTVCTLVRLWQRMKSRLA
jgi:hypothetical protein